MTIRIGMLIGMLLAAPCFAGEPDDSIQPTAQGPALETAADTSPYLEILAPDDKVKQEIFEASLALLAKAEEKSKLAEGQRPSKSKQFSRILLNYIKSQKSNMGAMIGKMSFSYPDVLPVSGFIKFVVLTPVLFYTGNAFLIAAIPLLPDALMLVGGYYALRRWVTRVADGVRIGVSHKVLDQTRLDSLGETATPKQEYFSFKLELPSGEVTEVFVGIQRVGPVNFFMQMSNAISDILSSANRAPSDPALTPAELEVPPNQLPELKLVKFLDKAMSPAERRQFYMEVAGVSGNPRMRILIILQKILSMDAPRTELISFLAGLQGTAATEQAERIREIQKMKADLELRYGFAANGAWTLRAIWNQSALWKGIKSTARGFLYANLVRKLDKLEMALLHNIIKNEPSTPEQLTALEDIQQKFENFIEQERLNNGVQQATGLSCPEALARAKQGNW